MWIGAIFCDGVTVKTFQGGLAPGRPSGRKMFVGFKEQCSKKAPISSLKPFMVEDGHWRPSGPCWHGIINRHGDVIDDDRRQCEATLGLHCLCSK